MRDFRFRLNLAAGEAPLRMREKPLVPNLDV